MGTQEYFKAYDAVSEKYDIGVREMLVLLKAYAQYKADEGQGKPINDRGWMNDVYDILPCFNRFGRGLINIPDSLGRAEEFWEPNNDNAHWRLSKKGLAFVDENPELFDAFLGVSEAVREVP